MTPVTRSDGRLEACVRCSGALKAAEEKSPNSGTGCIIIILGLVLTPLCIGIPIIIYGIGQMNEISVWKCVRCGATYPR
jgi:hypothetical protein